MPNLNIHWKGRPHHRLPRIRVASTPHNSIRTRSQIAAEQALRIPLGIALEQARKKHRLFRFRRRRGKSSTSSTSVVVRSRRHASQRAGQYIQVFGWGTSQAELASRYTIRSTGSGNRPNRPRGGKRPSAALQNQHPEDSILPSTDGAASSSVRRIKAYKREPENLYSLMHVAEVPIYWKSGKTANRIKSSFNSDRFSLHSARNLGAEYAHVGPLETARRRQISRGSPTLPRRRSYDSRIDPKNLVQDRRSKSNPAQARENTVGPSAPSEASPKNNQGSRVSAQLWEAVNSLGLQTKTDRSDTPSNKTTVPSISFDNASRTPSQRKALKKFTREIELYLQACQSLPKQSLVATPSLTTISAFTIDEFKPYQAQFQSAGLAVTSNEQRGLVKLEEELPPPPTPPKDLKWSKSTSSSDGRMGLRKDKQKEKRREPSYASGSTGTTVLGFTPPHERAYPRPKTAKQPSTDSEHTIIGFTPPQERVAPPPARPPPSPPKPLTKKSLPWLRRPDPSSGSVSPTNKMSGAPKAEKASLSSPLEDSIKTFESPKTKYETPERLKKSGPVVPPRPRISTRDTNVQRAEVESSNENADVSVKELPRIPAQQAQVSTQTRNVAADAMEPSVSTTTYADMTTQTSDDVEASQPNAEEAATNIERLEITKAQLIGGRNKTFPLTKNKCKGDCNAAPEPIPSSAPKSRKKSKVKWEGVDQEIQTDNIGQAGPQPDDDNQSRQDRKSPAKSDSRAGDRNSTSFSSSNTARGPGPFQASPALRSPNKSVDEGKVRTNIQIRDSVKGNLPPPTRQEPSPTPCTKYTNEQEPAAPERDPEHETLPEREPEPGPEPAPRPGLCHICTACSSLICEQCFPSRKTSAAISPKQTSPWEVQYAPSRRSTRDIIPAGPVPYSEETASPTRTDEAIQDTFKDSRSPEESLMPRQVVRDEVVECTDQSPIADPMKKPSLARLKLKLPTALQVPPQRSQYSTTSRPKSISQAAQPSTTINVSVQLPDLASISSFDTLPIKPGQITDKQVFKGLHVATAAAFDEDVDKWIEEITGSGVRKFLADLSRFEGLSVNTLGNVARRAARQRKERARAWEVVREARVAQHDAGGMDEKEVGKDWVLEEMGVVAVDGKGNGCRVVHGQDCEGGERECC